LSEWAKVAIFAVENSMKQKRFADWFEKMSAAFMVGAFLTDKNAFVAVCFGLFCLYLSMKLTERGRP
jgi:hypothetical protein